MKKLAVILAAAGVMFACGGERKQLVGTIEDASMNVLTVKSDAGETYTFSTEKADKTEGHGMLIGSKVTVEYKGELSEGSFKALKVTGDPFYAQVLGAWLMPDPIEPDKVMGFNLMIWGKAESIRMASLPFESWEMVPGEENKILLHGKSIGNGQTIDFTQAAVISEKDGKLQMQFEDSEIVLTKR